MKHRGLLVVLLLAFGALSSIAASGSLESSSGGKTVAWFDVKAKPTLNELPLIVLAGMFYIKATQDSIINNESQTPNTAENLKRTQKALFILTLALVTICIDNYVRTHKVWQGWKTVRSLLNVRVLGCLLGGVALWRFSKEYSLLILCMPLLLHGVAFGVRKWWYKHDFCDDLLYRMGMRRLLGMGMVLVASLGICDDPKAKAGGILHAMVVTLLVMTVIGYELQTMECTLDEEEDTQAESGFWSVYYTMTKYVPWVYPALMVLLLGGSAFSFETLHQANRRTYIMPRVPAFFIFILTVALSLACRRVTFTYKGARWLPCVVLSLSVGNVLLDGLWGLLLPIVYRKRPLVTLLLLAMATNVLVGWVFDEYDSCLDGFERLKNHGGLVKLFLRCFIQVLMSCYMFGQRDVYGLFSGVVIALFYGMVRSVGYEGVAEFFSDVKVLWEEVCGECGLTMEALSGVDWSVYGSYMILAGLMMRLNYPAMGCLTLLGCLLYRILGMWVFETSGMASRGLVGLFGVLMLVLDRSVGFGGESWDGFSIVNGLVGCLIVLGLLELLVRAGGDGLHGQGIWGGMFVSTLVCGFYVWFMFGEKRCLTIVDILRIFIFVVVIGCVVGGLVTKLLSVGCSVAARAWMHVGFVLLTCMALVLVYGFFGHRWLMSWALKYSGGEDVWIGILWYAIVVIGGLVIAVYIDGIMLDYPIWVDLMAKLGVVFVLVCAADFSGLTGVFFTPVNDDKGCGGLGAGGLAVRYGFLGFLLGAVWLLSLSFVFSEFGGGYLAGMHGGLLKFGYVGAGFLVMVLGVGTSLLPTLAKEDVVVSTLVHGVLLAGILYALYRGLVRWVKRLGVGGGDLLEVRDAYPYVVKRPAVIYEVRSMELSGNVCVGLGAALLGCLVLMRWERVLYGVLFAGIDGWCRLIDDKVGSWCRWGLNGLWK